MICQDLGQRLHGGYVRTTIASLLIYTGQYQQAQEQAARALPLLREAGERMLKAFWYERKGKLALADSSYVEAQAAFAESAGISREIGVSLIGPLAGLGYAACRLGQLSRARQHLAEALSSALAREAYISVVFALPGVALLLAKTGAVVRAVEIWALAKYHPFVANSKWFEDVAGRELDELAATLPPEVAEAVQARGRALDLWEAAAALLAELEATNIPEQDVIA